MAFGELVEVYGSPRFDLGDRYRLSILPIAVVSAAVLTSTLFALEGDEPVFSELKEATSPALMEP